jgi:hypothetical protein
MLFEILTISKSKMMTWDKTTKKKRRKNPPFRGEVVNKRLITYICNRDTNMINAQSIHLNWQYIANTYKLLLIVNSLKTVELSSNCAPLKPSAPQFRSYMCFFNGTPRGAAYSSTLYYIKYCWSTNVDHR